MIDRRDLIIGAVSAAAAGAAYALMPKRHVRLLGSIELDKEMPEEFGQWRRHQGAGIIKPKDGDSLAAKLYSQTVDRIYVKENGEGVMLLIAYGDTQNDLLQLHRPEVCYAAFGFNLSDNHRANISLGEGLALPARELTASTIDRTEYITYWTRLGEALPTDGKEQRDAKFDSQLNGIIPDGVLVRISTWLPDPQAAYNLNQAFASDFLHAISKKTLPALVGTKIANALSTTGPR